MTSFTVYIYAYSKFN